MLLSVRLAGAVIQGKRTRYSIAYPVSPAKMNRQALHGFKLLFAAAAGVDLLGAFRFFPAEVNFSQRIVYRVFHGNAVSAALAGGVRLAYADVGKVMDVVAVGRSARVLLRPAYLGHYRVRRKRDDLVPFHQARLYFLPVPVAHAEEINEREDAPFPAVLYSGKNQLDARREQLFRNLVLVRAFLFFLFLFRLLLERSVPVQRIQKQRFRFVLFAYKERLYRDLVGRSVFFFEGCNLAAGQRHGRKPRFFIERIGRPEHVPVAPVALDFNKIVRAYFRHGLVEYILEGLHAALRFYQFLHEFVGNPLANEARHYPRHHDVEAAPPGKFRAVVFNAVFFYEFRNQCCSNLRFFYAEL